MNWFQRIAQQPGNVSNLLVQVVTNNIDVNHAIEQLRVYGPDVQAQACNMIPALMGAHPDATTPLSQIQQTFCFDVQNENDNINPNPPQDVDPEQGIIQ